jgi:hypothetical protein
VQVPSAPACAHRPQQQVPHDEGGRFDSCLAGIAFLNRLLKLLRKHAHQHNPCFSSGEAERVAPSECIAPLAQDPSLLFYCTDAAEKKSALEISGLRKSQVVFALAWL